MGFFYIKKLALILSLSLMSSMSLSVHSSLAQETGSSQEADYIPRPKNPSNLAPLPASRRPFTRPRPIRQLTAKEIKELQARPCPGSDDCPGLPSEKDAWGHSFGILCKEFINDDGNYENTGVMMVEAMQLVERTKREANPSSPQCKFKENIDFGGGCPYFKYLNPQQKDHVLVWYWAAVAQAESSCDPAVDAEGIFNEELGRYNIADGLFGLEYHADTRITAGRDANFCPHSEVQDTKEIGFQTQCAASIMHDRNCQGSAFDTNTYWEESRTWQRKVGLLMQRHPLCAR